MVRHFGCHLIIAALLAGSAMAATITVEAGGGGDFPTINEALVAAAAGDLILVGPGTYEETIALEIPVHLSSTGGSAATIIAGPFSSQDALTVDAPGVTVEGFTLTAGRRGLTLTDEAGGINLIDITIEESGAYPVAMPVDMLNDILPMLNLVPHASGQFEAVLLTSGTITTSRTWPVLPAGMVYHLSNAVVTIAGPDGPVLTIPDGSIVKSWFSRFEIGTSSEPGGLMANDVIFTSLRDDVGGDTDGSTLAVGPGQWNRLDFNATARTDSSRITNCEIRYGGSGNGVIEIRDSDPLITGNTFTENTTELNVSGSLSLGANQTGNTIIQGDGLPIWTSLAELENLLFNNTLTPRGDDKWNGIRILGSDVTTSYTLPVLPFGFVYFLENATIDIAGPSGPVLTIPDGTIVKCWYSRFEVGSNSEPGGFMANDVLFTSIRDDEGGDTNGSTLGPARGQWNRIDFNPMARADSSSVTNCELRYGGSGTAAVEVRESDPLITGNIFQENDVDLWVKGTPSQGANQMGNTITQGDGRPIVTTLAELDNVVFGNTLIPRGDDKWNGIQILGSTVSSSYTLPVLPHDFVYFLDSQAITVAGPEGPVLTIPDGTIIKCWYSRFEIGSGGEPGGLMANDVIFTSTRDDVGGDTAGNNLDPNPGQWNRLDFTADARDDSCQVTNCEFRYGGSGPATVEVVGSDPVITGNSFTDCNAVLKISGSASLGANQSGNTIVQANDLPITTPIDHLEQVVFGNTITPRGDDKWNGIKLMGSTVSEDFTLPVLPHDFVYVLDSVTISVVGENNPVLTIPDGTIIKSWYSRFEIGGNDLPGGLIATGTLFTSTRDDTGGDTNGNNFQPTRGNWNRLDFNPGAGDAVCRLIECEFRYGGSGTGTIEARESRPQLDRCLITESQGPAVVSRGVGANPTLRLCSLQNNGTGLHAYDDGYARLIRVCFEGNDIGLEVEPPEGGLGTFQALNCWWGAADGPSGEGPGSGDSIVGPADFAPWYTSEACLDFSGAEDAGLPRVLALEAAYPNPFNPSTRIAFALPDEQDVALRIYALDGRLVRTLVQDTRAAGRHEVMWNGQDDQGRPQAAGVYFYRLTAGDEERTAKMMLVK